MGNRQMRITCITMNSTCALHRREGRAWGRKGAVDGGKCRLIVKKVCGLVRRFFVSPLAYFEEWERQ